MNASFPDLSVAIGRAVEEARRRLEEELGEAIAWVEWIRAGAPGAKGCVLCGSRGKKEMNHIAGRKHGDLVVQLCIGCHRKFTAGQNTWDGRWQSEKRSPDLDRSLLIRGLLDLTEARAAFSREPGAYLALAGRLRELYARAARDAN
jgi:hypothetical protein